MTAKRPARVAMAAGLAAAAVASAQPREPTVTAREAERLAQAAAVAETNTTAAIALLDEGRRDASAALDFAVGNFLFQLDRHEPAVEAYREAVRKLPSFRSARMNMGRAYLLLGREDEAIRVYQDLVGDGYADMDAFLLLGHGLMLRGHAVPAESAYRQALMLAPGHRDATRGLVQALLDQQRFQETRSLLRTALDAEPAEAAYWALLANVEVALGDTQGAIRALETARRLEACPPAGLMLLGDLYLDAGQPAAAVACYEQARAGGGIGPDRFLRAVEGLIMLGEAGRARVMLEQVEASPEPAGRRDPATARTITRLRAELAVLAGDPARAVALFRELSAGDPLDARALLRLGELLEETGADGEADLVYERVGRLAGHEAESLVRRAAMAVRAGRVAEAVECLETAERIEPRAHVARYLEQVRRLQD